MNKLSSICEKTIATGFYFLFLLIPLIFTPWTRELFEFPKMLLVYAITIVITAAFAIKSVIDSKLSIAKTPLDKPILAFLIVYLVSTLFSMNRYTSVFGYYTRFNGGLLSVICFITLYYILNSEVKDRRSGVRFSKLIFCILLSAFLVSVWGILEHFGVDKNYWKQNVQARVFSTLGQPNWLASYLAAIIPIPLSLLFSDSPISKTTSNERRSRAVLFTVYCLLFTTAYAATWFTYSLSGLLGLLTALMTFFILTPKIYLKKRWRILILAVICIAISISSPGLFLPRIREVFKISRHSDSATFENVAGEESSPIPRESFAYAQDDGGEEASEIITNPTTQSLIPKALELGGRTGRVRLIVWKGAIDLIFSDLKTALIGTGPETFAYAFLPYRPKELNQTIEWDFLYNKAHNEYLNLGAGVGLLGLGSYLWFIVKFIRFSLFVILNPERQLKGEESLNLPEQLPGLSETSSGILRSAQDDGKDNLLIIGIFSGWVSLLVTSFFGFHVVATSLLFWLYPAIVFCVSAKSQKSKIKSQK